MRGHMCLYIRAPPKGYGGLMYLAVACCVSEWFHVCVSYSFAVLLITPRCGSSNSRSDSDGDGIGSSDGDSIGSSYSRSDSDGVAAADAVTVAGKSAQHTTAPALVAGAQWNRCPRR